MSRRLSRPRHRVDARGRRVMGKSAVSLSVGLALGLVACSEGCSRELPVTEPEFVHTSMTVEQLAKLLIPEGNGRWRALPEHELFALERVVAMLVEQAPHGQLRAGQQHRVAKLAAASGLELHEVELEHDGRRELLWVLVEPVDDRRGRGVYVIRLGELAGAPELLLQAPHVRFDKHTGTIAMRMFTEHGHDARMRALFLNSVHRYAREDGSRRKQEQAEDNQADAAHNEDHPFARATARTLLDSELTIVQLHGFERDAAAGDADLIVSAGSRKPHTWAMDIVTRLRSELSEFSVALFGVDTDRLGALTNVEGHAARTTGRCFVHVEASGPVRELLRDDAEVRRRFVHAVFGSEVVGSRGGCQ